MFDGLFYINIPRVLCFWPLICIIAHAYLIVILFISYIALFSLRFISLFDKTETIATAYNFAKVRKNRAIYGMPVFKIMNKSSDTLDEIYMFSLIWIYLSRKSL